jgi:hypothetical protein
LPRRDIGFVKRENFSQKDIEVLPKERNLAKKKYRFYQKRKFELRIDIGFAKKKS